MAVYVNRIATAVPPHDIHARFLDYAGAELGSQAAIFRRLAKRSQIDHRYSVFEAATGEESLDAEGIYRPATFPSTGLRMELYKQHALPLARQALDAMALPSIASEITHLIVTSCTGFYAPGLDLQIVETYGLAPSVERSIIGFMGCYAAVNALKQAFHTLRSQPSAKIVIVNLELCTLHLQETREPEQLLSFLHFADGCAAALITSTPGGIELQDFHCTILPDSDGHITWHIGDQGFDMMLSTRVPAILETQLTPYIPIFTGGLDTIRHWAVHPGGRAVLDAIEKVFSLDEKALAHSREILRRYGNMSSATLMFVLKEMLAEAIPGEGCAMAFGPGLTAETFRFHIGSRS